METLIPHEIEPEISVPTPRRVRQPWSTELLLALSTALTLLLLIGGARALLEAGRLAWAAVAGRHVEAHLTSIVTTVGPDKVPVPVGAYYRYDDPLSGKNVVRYAAVERLPDASTASLPGLGNTASPAPSPAPLHVGDALALRIIGGRGHEHLYFWTNSPLGKGLFVALCGGAVMAVGLRLLLVLSRWRRGRMHLLRNGYAVIGTIVHKPTDFGDTPRYYVRYGYAARDGHEAREHEEQVSLEQWKRFEIGQPVTVLYDPQAFGRAGLYALIR